MNSKRALDTQSPRVERLNRIAKVSVVGALGAACFLAWSSAAEQEMTPPSSNASSSRTAANSGESTTQAPSASETSLTESVTPSPDAEETVLPECIEGEPVSFSWPAMDMNDIPIEKIGLLENGALDTPSKFAVGWYAAGPKPGSGEGNVLLDFHMYPDGTGLVGLDFEQRVALLGIGSMILLQMDNGSTCSYEINNQATVDKYDTENGFPKLLEKYGLYRQDGSEGVVAMTCASNEWNWAESTSQGETVAWGYRINRVK